MQISTVGGAPASGTGSGLLPTRSADTTPWSSMDVLAMLVLLSFGVAGDLICWWGVSGVPTFKREMPWLLGSIASTGIAVIGLVSLLVAGARAVTDLRELETVRIARLVADGSLGSKVKSSEAGTVRSGANSATLAVVSGSRRYHGPDCQMIRGKANVVMISRAEASDRPLLPCGVCEPG